MGFVWVFGAGPTLFPERAPNQNQTNPNPCRAGLDDPCGDSQLGIFHGSEGMGAQKLNFEGKNLIFFPGVFPREMVPKSAAPHGGKGLGFPGSIPGISCPGNKVLLLPASHRDPWNDGTGP